MPTILIVEDERSARVSLGRLLTQEGYRVKYAEEGMDALVVFEEENVDLVLLDPPYRLEQAKLEGLLSEIAGQVLVSAGGRLVLTRPARSYNPVIPVHFVLERRLSYGDSALLVFTVPEQP